MVYGGGLVTGLSGGGGSPVGILMEAEEGEVLVEGGFMAVDRRERIVCLPPALTHSSNLHPPR